jgi:two-component system LytT family sensor kinase
MANSSIRQQASRIFQNYRWILHLVFWIGLSSSFVIGYLNSNFLIAQGYTKPIIIFSFIIRFITFFLVAYSFLLYVVPLSKKAKKHVYWLSFAGVVVFWFLLQTSILALTLNSISYPLAHSNHSFLALAIRHYPSYLLFLCIFISFYYFVDIYDQQKSIKRLQHYKTQKIALESSFLKSQVNPHFLFNTLNNIYALSMKKSEQTKVIIERLESLLHYMLYECKADLVPLENEFTFTDSYIALEKLRHKEDQCTVTVQINGEVGHKKIAPLLLINFLENAFKHGTKSSFGKSWINLDIDIQEQTIHFRLQNSKPFNMVGQAISEYKGGIGLKNVKRRLEILYPQRHELAINNFKDRFEVDLSIDL